MSPSSLVAYRKCLRSQTYRVCVNFDFLVDTVAIFANNLVFSVCAGVYDKYDVWKQKKLFWLSRLFSLNIALNH